MIVARPEREAFEEAARGLEAILVRTPLVPLAGADDVLLKLETLQVGGSFKTRGVYWALASMDAQRRARGVSTVSAGNTAKALAWSARRFGTTARSLMPDSAPRTKVEAVRALGGTPVLVPTDEVFRFLKERLWEGEPWGFVHPWTDRDVLIGHGSLALELVEQCPDVGTVLLPVGGGGLLGGVGSALRAVRPGVRIVGVEPAGCPSFFEARRAGRPVDVACDTICDGVAVPYVTDEMFPLLCELVDDMVLVDEVAVRAAVRHLALANHVVAEGAGALATAAALQADASLPRPIVCPVTGGSIDAELLASVLTE